MAAFEEFPTEEHYPVPEERSWLDYFTLPFWETQTVTEVDISQLPRPKLLKAVKYSQHAYLSLDDAMKEPELEEARADQVEGFPKLLDGGKTGAQVYVWLSKSTKEIHLAYRGTETDSLKDILTDLRIPLVQLFPKDSRYKEVKVHKGFYVQFISVQKSIEELLSKYTDSFDTIVHTGHSLGAALACLSAVTFASQLPKKKRDCITIGCPRAGNDDFAALFRHLIPVSWRIANENDPIPMMAPFTVYQHAQRSLTIDDNNQATYRSEPLFSHLRLSLAKEDVDWSRRIADDHSSELYYQRLEAVLNGQQPQA